MYFLTPFEDSDLSVLPASNPGSNKPWLHSSGSIVVGAFSGGGGVTDHGALSGLADDDHPQYHNDARGDARYYTQAAVDSALSSKADSTAVTTALEAKADVSYVDAGLSTKANAAAVAAALAGKADEATTLAGYGITDAAPLVHSHSAADITSGTVATARLGSGVADATTFLRGDGSWQPVSGGGGGIGGSTGTVDNRVLRSDGTGGATLQASSVTIDDMGVLTAQQVTTQDTFNFRTDSFISGSATGVAFRNWAATDYIALTCGAIDSKAITANGRSKIYGANGAVGSSTYDLSLQNNSTSCWLEILNNGGSNKGAFFGITSNDFQIWNYQGGPIIFFTDTVATSGLERLRVSPAGEVSVSGPLKLQVKTIATLPAAAASANQRYIASDSAVVGGRCVFSNGTAWYYEDGTAV